MGGKGRGTHIVRDVGCVRGAGVSRRMGGMAQSGEGDRASDPAGGARSWPRQAFRQHTLTITLGSVTDSKSGVGSDTHIFFSPPCLPFELFFLLDVKVNLKFRFVRQQISLKIFHFKIDELTFDPKIYI